MAAGVRVGQSFTAMRRARRAAAVALLVLGCAGPETTQGPERNAVARVDVSAASGLLLNVGDSVVMDVVLRDVNGDTLSTAGRTIQWSVTPSPVATITSTGMLVGLAEGDGMVEARVGTVVGRASFSVRSRLSWLFVYGPSSLRVGDTSRAVAHLRDADSVEVDPETRGIRWSISPSSVAQVDSSGKITALAIGTAVLRAQVEHLKDSLSFEVESLPPPPTGPPPTPPGVVPPLAWPYYVTVLPPKRMLVGDTASAWVRVMAYGMVQFSVDSGAVLSSSSSSIAAISSLNRIIGVSAGTATITATYRSSSGSGPTQVLGPPPAWADFISLSVGELESCGVQRADGSLLCWGEGGQYGNPYNTGDSRAPMRVLAGEAGFVSTPGARCGIRADGTVRCNTGTQWIGPASAKWRRFLPDAYYVAPASCGILTDSSAACWQGGDSVVTQANGMRFIDLHMPESYSPSATLCGVRTDSTAVCWGRGTTTLVPVPELTQLVEVRMGERHACFLKADGSVWCRGDNDRGQLGDGTRLPRVDANRVTGLPAVTSIHTYRSSTCAITTEGRGWCWGDDIALTPSLLPFTGDLVDISIGVVHKCALKADGSAWCWGANPIGQLGDGTQLARTLPSRVRGSYPP